MNKIKNSVPAKIFNVLNIIILTAFTALMVLPLLYVAAISLSSPQAVDRKDVFLFPVELTFSSWKYILGLKEIWVSVGLTAFVTVVGTFLALFLNSLMAYPLSKKSFPLSKVLMLAVVLSMIFKAPTIPYFLTLRNLGLFNNILVLILPHIFVPYNLIIMVSFFRQIPIELEEAAKIEGCGYFRLLFHIVLPCSKAVLSTLGLFYAVMIWNQFSHPLMFIDNSSLYPLQLKIRQFTSGTDLMGLFAADAAKITFNNETLRAAVVLFSILPIASVYPFIQKSFIKGAMIGSVKG